MATILIVDDNEPGRELIEAYLRRGRHRALSASSGEAALALVAREPIDLAVVDLDLPGEDGQQVMRQLKASARGEYLPVILLAPFGDQHTRLGAWRAGADEVLARPVHREELMVRIDNLLALRAERLEMARANAALRDLQGFKDQLDQLLVHDLKNPLAALTANLEYLGGELQGNGELVEVVDDSLAASRRLQRMVASILDVSAFEENALRPTRVAMPLAPLLGDLRRWQQHANEDRRITLRVDCAADLAVHVDPELFTRVVENLFEAAMRRTQRAGTLSLSARAIEGGRVRLAVVSSGIPVPEDQRAHLFEKYGPVETRGHGPRVGVGLGLYFSRLAVEAHGGRVFLGDDGPVAFVVELPAAPVAGVPAPGAPGNR